MKIADVFTVQGKTFLVGTPRGDERFAFGLVQIQNPNGTMLRARLVRVEDLACNPRILSPEGRYGFLLAGLAASHICVGAEMIAGEVGEGVVVVGGSAPGEPLETPPEDERALICPDCGGYGNGPDEMQGDDVVQRPCPTCHGKGRVVEDPVPQEMPPQEPQDDLDAFARELEADIEAEAREAAEAEEEVESDAGHPDEAVGAADPVGDAGGASGDGGLRDCVDDRGVDQGSPGVAGAVAAADVAVVGVVGDVLPTRGDDGGSDSHSAEPQGVPQGEEPTGSEPSVAPVAADATAVIIALDAETAAAMASREAEEEARAREEDPSAIGAQRRAAARRSKKGKKR